MTGQTALVTGASSGIGLELARCFAEDGHRLIIAADNAEQLDRAAEALRGAGAETVETAVVDLADPAGPRELYEAAHRLHGTPDFLVNNAGAGVHGNFIDETALEDELAIIQLNIVSVVHLTKLFAPEMARRGGGRILITSSIVALAPSPKLTVYSATKAFDFAFAEALANELQGSGVTVTALMPSVTETEFFARAGMEDTKLARSEKADPATVARAGYDAMMKGTDHVLSPFTARMQAAMTCVMPMSVVTQQARAE